MTITRVGTNEKYANGWLAAFGKGASAAKKEASKGTKKKAPAKKAAPKKKAAKKKSKA